MTGWEGTVLEYPLIVPGPSRTGLDSSIGDSPGSFPGLILDDLGTIPGGGLSYR